MAGGRETLKYKQTSRLACGSHQVSLLPRAVNSKPVNLSYARWRAKNLGTKIFVTVFALVQVVVYVKRSLYFLLGTISMGRWKPSIIMTFSAYKNFLTALICTEIMSLFLGYFYEFRKIGLIPFSYYQ